MSVSINKFEKYQTRDLKVLDTDEQLREINVRKIGVCYSLFVDDIELAKKYKFNVSRIIRHKFGEWLREKIAECESESEELEG